MTKISFFIYSNKNTLFFFNKSSLHQKYPETFD